MLTSRLPERFIVFDEFGQRPSVDNFFSAAREQQLDGRGDVVMLAEAHPWWHRITGDPIVEPLQQESG